MTDLAIGAATAANPFSTRCIRPGSQPFIFADNEDAPLIVARFVALGCRAQIVGPHGVGKSTLLAALVPALAAAGRPAYRIALHDGQRRLPIDWRRNANEESAKTILIDGFEQLSRLSRWRLKLACRRRDWGLLVTAHRDVGLPTLVELAPSLVTFRRVVDRLLQPHADEMPSELVAASFAACGGNMREALLALYDDYERLRYGRRAVAPQVSDCAGCDDGAARECSASSDGTSAQASG
jgi:hypothetical protein